MYFAPSQIDDSEIHQILTAQNLREVCETTSHFVANEAIFPALWTAPAHLGFRY